MALTGGCLCGAVRYRLYGEPYHVTHCHCRSCRKASGAAFVTWFSVRVCELAWLGEPMKVFHSSAAVERGFCPHCGTTLSYQYLTSPDEIDLTLSTLDDPEALTPEDHIWWSERLRWAEGKALAQLPHHSRFREDGG